ncbi:hypothetical protein [Luteolibacter sp. AS25]|uniref:hypothetical protein n=1 Tax=Luteolibacter sp. AS25 TaxID=3135776 RepID=UPI00398A5896
MQRRKSITSRLSSIALPAIFVSFMLFSCEKSDPEVEAPAGQEAKATKDRKAKQRTDEIWPRISEQENITVSEIRENSEMEILTESPTTAEINALQEKAVALLDKGDFTALDEMATGFLNGKERFPNGCWKIKAFHEFFELNDNLPTKIWESRGEALGKWISEKPDSQFPRISLAAFYVDYAWRARGGGFASTVSDEGWRLMTERLGKAGDVLEAAFAETEITDPSIYVIATRIALGAGLPPDAFDSFVVASLELEPGYHHTLLSRGYSLLPRWYGEPGDWEFFAKYVAEENKEMGKERYARIVLDLFAFRQDTVNYRKLDRDLFKEGVREIHAKYPDAITELSEAAYLATVAKDRKFAEECFDMLGDRCLVPVWKVNGRMAHYRNWAKTGKW